MSSEYAISKASPEDASAIASLFAMSWTSPFTQLQFGDIEPATLAASMAPRIVAHMGNPDITFTVARSSETKEVVAVAQWTLPSNSDDERSGNPETDEEKEERQEFEDEAYRRNLPKASNKELIMFCLRRMREVREETLRGTGPCHYLLDNLATHPDHRGRGLASKLIASTLENADKSGHLSFLETASDNEAMRLYKRLGFQEKGSWSIENLNEF
ncbi:acyl-CoA N-acyltransferase, partial [Pleomassaria siparia CBS 279.74]